MSHLSETYIKLDSNEISFTQNIHASCRIVLKICIEPCRPLCQFSKRFDDYASYEQTRFRDIWVEDTFRARISYTVTVLNVGFHYDVIVSAMVSQITSLTIIHSTVYSGRDQGKHQVSASLAFVRGIHRWPVNSPHKGPLTWKMFSFDDVIMR